jgi:hypothetical protein
MPSALAHAGKEKEREENQKKSENKMKRRERKRNFAPGGLNPLPAYRRAVDPSLFNSGWYSPERAVALASPPREFYAEVAENSRPPS